MKKSQAFILDLREMDKAMLPLVGGKAANLGELSKIDGVKVPGGFCVTTGVYKEVIEHNKAFNSLVGQLSALKVEDRKAIQETSAKIRKLIESTPVPANIVNEITRHLTQAGEKNAYVIRSSATAEDLPTASFAGQQDTYLNIIGKESVLTHISKCWASLFTERAVIYRLQNGFEHRKVLMSVVVQQMIFPDTSGIMFTADPVSSNRKVLSIDASFGLGEALVSGLVNADNYKVKQGAIFDKKIPVKKLAVYAMAEGGTNKQEIETALQNQQALTDEQILMLERTGRKIEQHFGCPQDIEWCISNDTVYIVQARPVTTLYPVPEANDQENRVYISVGHQQMMTDAMKPLGLSLWRITRMHKAGGRLFVDVTPQLSSSASRKALLNAMAQHDPLIKDAITTIIERDDFIKLQPDESKEADINTVSKTLLPQIQIDYDPSIVPALITRSEEALATLKQDIETISGPELFDFILDNIQQLNKKLFDPKNLDVIMAAINASIWLNEKMYAWLGEKNVSDTLSQSVPNNITSEMGMELLDMADIIRPYPELVHYLTQVKEENFLDEMVAFNGGKEARDAINNYLSKYGMRCAGEIDITKTRWAENPGALIPLILSNIRNVEAGASKRRYEQGLQEALKKEQDLLHRLNQLPGGESKASETKKMIDLVRHFSGYREYPKYGIVNRYFVYKQALLQETERLVQAGVIHEKEDVYYLTFEEFREAVRTSQLDYQLISKRKDEHKQFEKLTPPRVITSDGEIVTGQYKKEHLPANAMAGLAVSSGMIEGRARIILQIEEANLEDGDILVTAFTDPSWTPLFLSIKGLVTEVGGLMTHGAVIAREYGLPAVVGVEHATKLIKDGQRIRVNGTDGYVEIL